MDKLPTIPNDSTEAEKFVLNRNRRIYSDSLFSHGDEVFIQPDPQRQVDSDQIVKQ